VGADELARKATLGFYFADALPCTVMTLEWTAE